MSNIPPPGPPKPPADARIKLGDSVWVKFKLTYRKDLVAKRADREHYQRLRFQIQSSGGRVATAEPFCPPDVPVTADDQEVEGIFVFENTPKMPDFIKEGDRWLLEVAYTADEEFFPPSGSRRIHRIGEVQISAEVPPLPPTL